MDTENGKNSGLQGAFGDRGTNVNAISYGHPHAEKVLVEAKEILRTSETGRALVRVQEHFNIPVHVMKGKPDDGSGYSPDMKKLFLQLPGKTDVATGEFVINFAIALREADLELGGDITPDPYKDFVEYAAFVHARNVDTIMHACMIIKELTESSYFSVLLDSLQKLGFNNFYNAYLDGASKEELYDHYADAYDSRGEV